MWPYGPPRIYTETYSIMVKNDKIRITLRCWASNAYALRVLTFDKLGFWFLGMSAMHILNIFELVGRRILVDF